MTSPPSPFDYAKIDKSPASTEATCQIMLEELRAMRMEMREMWREFSLERRRHFKILLGAIIAFGVLLETLLALGFGWI